MDYATLLQLFDSTLRLATPLLLACLAGLYSERSGVFDIGLEGKMLVAAMCAGAVAFYSGNAWVGALSRQILQAPGRVVVVAHSLGCIATAHLPEEAAARIQGALLVAPADPERRAVLSDFAPVPFAKLPYRSVLVASSNDPFCPIRLAGAYARAWGSEFVRLQEAGHINIDSGHGEWPLGLALLQSLVGDPATAPETSLSLATA